MDKTILIERTSKRLETAFSAEFLQNQDTRCPVADLCHFVRYKGNCSELCRLLHAAVAMKQTTRNEISWISPSASRGYGNTILPSSPAWGR